MQARRLPARHGALWLMGGIGLFRANPPMLTMVAMAYLLVIFLSLLHAAASFLLPVVMPTLTLLVANSCRAIEKGGRPMDSFTDGLREHRDSLLRLGGLQLLGSLAILAAAYFLGIGTESISDGKPDPKLLLGTLLPLLALGAPLFIAFWFAPLLTGWDGLPPIKSVFFSFVAVLRNWRAFITYGVAIVVAGIVVPGLLIAFAGSVSQSFGKVVSTVVWMLFIFVLSPALMASVYLSYRDVFTHE